MFSFLLGIYVGVKLLDRMGTLCSPLRNRQTVFQSGCIILHSHNQFMTTAFPHSHQYLLLSLFFHYSHPSGCKIVSHHGFDLYFLDGYDVEHFFMCLFTIYIFSLEKWILRSFAHFSTGLFVLLLTCNHYLYILDTNPLLDLRFAKIFSHSVDCLFTLCPLKYQSF